MVQPVPEGSQSELLRHMYAQRPEATRACGLIWCPNGSVELAPQVPSGRWVRQVGLLPYLVASLGGWHPLHVR